MTSDVARSTSVSSIAAADAGTAAAQNRAQAAASELDLMISSSTRQNAGPGR
jgi:hypothetical protein